jgi:TetR/AcrR family transcriptional regulator, cholesterol catabolism regulator
VAEPFRGRGANRPPAPRPESLDVRQRARRDRIVQAALRLMMSTDYDSLQMKDITVEACVALGTTYRYFNSKEHLVAEALLVWAMQFGQEVVATEPDELGRLKTAYRRAVRAFELSPPMYHHMLAAQGSSDPRVREIFDLFASGQVDAFADYLASVPSPTRERIIAVMNAVLGDSLRAWSLGRATITDVYDAIDSAAGLLLGQETPVTRDTSTK